MREDAQINSISMPAVAVSITTRPKAAQEAGLAIDQVNVWHIRVNDQIARVSELREFLSEDEVTAARRFRFECDQQRYVVVRGILRRLLASCLSEEPARLQFRYGAYGKPELAPEWISSGLQFNVSHSGDMAIFAVTRDRAVGIDLEHVRPRSSLEQLAERLFSPRDLLAWHALPSNDRLVAFYRSWTWKESYLKATGRGLSGELDGFTIQLVPNGGLQLPDEWCDQRESRHWSFAPLNPAPGYIGMVAAEGADWVVQESEFCW